MLFAWKGSVSSSDFGNGPINSGSHPKPLELVPVPYPPRSWHVSGCGFPFLCGLSCGFCGLCQLLQSPQRIYCDEGTRDFATGTALMMFDDFWFSTLYVLGWIIGIFVQQIISTRQPLILCSGWCCSGQIMGSPSSLQFPCKETPAYHSFW